ncbi:DUF6907 domain-containing protein [Streptomyces sp. NPDC020983]|uniref:DUF6907 domain-containing protein n=1 Tax=Streptomyces sp. NPDC020983 TaxID=3365106 RepID=UPI00378D8E67
MPVTAPDLWDGPQDEPVVVGSIGCNPRDPPPRRRVPVVNLQLADGRWSLGLRPEQLAEVAAKLRELPGRGGTPLPRQSRNRASCPCPLSPSSSFPPKPVGPFPTGPAPCTRR